MLRLMRKTNFPSDFCGFASRAISTTSIVRVKEIKVEQKGDVLEIRAELKPSPRTELLMKEVKAPNAKFCPKCTLGLDIKHTDVLILSQFLREDGHILPRRITGLCAVQQKNIGTMIIMAKLAGLMPSTEPTTRKRDPKRPFGWKKINKYFDENTIKYAKRPVNY